MRSGLARNLRLANEVTSRHPKVIILFLVFPLLTFGRLSSLSAWTMLHTASLHGTVEAPVPLRLPQYL